MTDLVLERFWDKVKVDESTGCWNWQACISVQGYGQFTPKYGTTVRAHRFAYEVNKGKIPEGLVLDHLCRNKICVNPDHLEAVTDKVNLLRGFGACAKNSRKTHCKRGHLITGIQKNGRICEICEQKRLTSRNRYKLAILLKSLFGE